MLTDTVTVQPSAGRGLYMICQCVAQDGDIFLSGNLKIAGEIAQDVRFRHYGAWRPLNADPVTKKLYIPD